MGILEEPLQFIRDLQLPRGFSVCELGDQFITCESPAYPASKFYQSLGCGKYISIDGNGRGSVTADLNKPLDPALGRFDIVTDFGTGEHVFHQMQVWKSLHHLAKENGHIVFDRPCDGYEGHCFYLIQWNLITALAHANAYVVVKLEERKTTRGKLLRGVLKKRVDRAFILPQQGRYFKDLIIDHQSTRRGAEHKSQELRAAGLVGKQRLEKARDNEESLAGSPKTE